MSSPYRPVSGGSPSRQHYTMRLGSASPATSPSRGKAYADGTVATTGGSGGNNTTTVEHAVLEQAACNVSPPRTIMYVESDQPFGLLNNDPVARRNRHPKFCINTIGQDGALAEDQIREIFNYFDADGNGYLNKSEFKNVFKEVFETFGAPMDDREVESLFEKFDSPANKSRKRGGSAGASPKQQGGGGGGDGKLSFDEFAILILSLSKL